MMKKGFKPMNVFEAVQNANPDGIAIEAIIQAEEMFLRGEVTQEDIDEINGNTDGINQMAFKDDDGYWRVTGRLKKWESYEDLLVDYPDL